MGSAGLTTVLFNRAELTFAAGASRYGEQEGKILHGTLRTKIADIDIRLNSQRTFDDYADLATVVGLDALDENAMPEDFARQEPPRAQDTLHISMPVGSDNGAFGLSLIHSERADDRNTLLSASYSRRLVRNEMSFHFSAFRDFADAGGYGLSARLLVPLGKHRNASAGLSRGHNGDVSRSAHLSKPVGKEIGATGYRLDLNDTRGGATSVEVGGSYRGRYGLAELRLRDNGRGRSSAAGVFSGALALTKGGLFAGNYIRDGFAAVDVGVPDVPVKLHNRDVARTGLLGKALVTDLRAYRHNRVSIDPKDLPLDAAIEATAMTVVPARGSGVHVKFGGGVAASALVVLRDGQGNFIPAGTPVRLNNAAHEFFVGWDGELWLEGLNPRNRIETATCRAEFTYRPTPGQQVVIEDVECL